MNMLQSALKQEGTFAERKLARIAAGARAFSFGVWASGLNAPIAGPIATFSSRRQAEEFAFEPTVASGATRAWLALYRLDAQRNTNAIGISSGQSFEVRRIDAAAK